MIKVAILGCRGIPNHYGGYGQLAEYLSVGLVKKGFSVTVYNSHNHPYQESKWNGVDIIHVNDPEHKLGSFGQFIYDLNAIKDIRKKQFDVILQLGYTSSTIWSWLFPKGVPVLTNMDGLEWKRSKYSWSVRQFLKFAEYLGVKTSTSLISDSIGIKYYLTKKYKASSTFIAYGASVFNRPDASVLAQYNLAQEDYNMLVARIEPENHIQEIIEAHLASETTRKLLVVGHTTKNSFGKSLYAKYKNDGQIIFTQGIYDLGILNNLRYFSHLYVHGHSVGGTNPSLLEAMASNALLIVHENPFNRAVVKKCAFTFSSKDDLTELFASEIEKQNHTKWLDANRLRIEKEFNWPKIIDEYAQIIRRNAK